MKMKIPTPAEILSLFKKDKPQHSKQDISRMENKSNMYDALAFNLSNSTNWASLFDGNKSGGLFGYSPVISFDTKQLRQKSRIAMFDSPQAASAINRMNENVINAGLTLESIPMWNIVASKKIKKERVEWTRKIEQYWKLFSNSKEVSYDRKNTFQQLQSFFYHDYLRDGEIFIILRYSQSRIQLNPLSVQVIDASNVVDPESEMIDAAIKRGNKIIDGIEFDKTGQEVAYYILDTMTSKVKKVLKYGINSGRLLVIHSMIHEYSDQVRGIPYLSGVLHEMKKITDYSLLELQAAVVNAVIAVWIEPSEKNDSSTPLSGVKEKSVYQQDPANSIVDDNPSKAAFDKGGLIVQNLKAGEKIQGFDTKRPNLNFDNFVTSITKNLSSSKSIPMEVLTMTFGQNYSASRASLLLFWNNVIMQRSNFIADTLNPIFEMWMLGEVEAGRIDAPGFGNMLIRKAWLHKRWIGIPQPSIDPLKEGKAVTARLADGLTTREIESQKNNGTSYDENIEKLTEENKQLRDAQGGMDNGSKN